ncbi:bifunctional nicotinamidase/pyrazinamidase [Gracilinema caldarium]|uniref:bifunctional nicotinamidase/pyrazinamidase n=1 Tax=Gracilinema caldarium TaxID=215591 RepID=UPI0026E9B80A|nr:bifunctional nicotinamidase/pyrazinamidase [Gracilinema caldarium]
MALLSSDTALLIIDVQNDFCPPYHNKDGSISEPGALAVAGANEILGPINMLSALCEKQGVPVIATQDWHPRNHCSFSSTHAAPGEEQGIWPDHCVQGTKGADFHPELNLNPIRLIVRKGFRPYLDSYSAFFENDRCTPTGLEFYLKGLGVSKIVVTGLATDYCVKYSALDARRLGFEVMIVSDAVRGVDYPAGSLQKALVELETAGVSFIDSAEII